PARAEVYRGVLRAAGEHLATGAFDIVDPLVTLGTQVTRPATEYGYLRPKLERGADIGGLRAYPLAAFEEKPKLARAEELQAEEGVAWNAGIFLWRRRGAPGGGGGRLERGDLPVAAPGDPPGARAVHRPRPAHRADDHRAAPAP